MASKIRKMLKYRWAESIRRGVAHYPTADVAHRELERIRAEHGGRLKAEHLLAEAKKTASPFHKCFVWDVKKAATLAWLDTARLIIRSVIVERVGQDPHHAFFQVHEQRVRFYSPANEIMSNRVHAQQLLNEAEAYYISGRNRYDEIVKLAKLHGVIDETFGKKGKRKRA